MYTVQYIQYSYPPSYPPPPLGVVWLTSEEDNFYLCLYFDGLICLCLCSHALLIDPPKF